MDKKKILFVVADGLGDRGCVDLGGKTPLQATDTPNLDWFAKNGSSGIVDIIAPGVRPGSDTAHTEQAVDRRTSSWSGIPCSSP